MENNTTVKKTFVPFAIPKEEGKDIGDTVWDYLETWKSGEYFGWDYKKECNTTADIWNAIADFEAHHCSADKHIFGFAVFCSTEDTYEDITWVGYFNDYPSLVIYHDIALEWFVDGGNCADLLDEAERRATKEW